MKKKQQRAKRSYAPRRFWSDAEVAHLVELYPTTPTAEIASTLRCAVSRVYAKAMKLGLRKTADYLASPAACRLRRGDNVGAEYRFQPGIVPWNKGTRFVAGGRSPSTRFKPGHRPHTWVPVGSYRINCDGYLDRKVSDTGYPPRDWVGVHRLVWIDANGPIPEGHVIVFKPGRRTTVLEQITPDALECVSRAVLMKRNSYHRWPKDLALAVQLRGALVRQINKRMGKEARSE